MDSEERLDMNNIMSVVTMSSAAGDSNTEKRTSLSLLSFHSLAALVSSKAQSQNDVEWIFLNVILHHCG